jgi:hypothetical protein
MKARGSMFFIGRRARKKCRRHCTLLVQSTDFDPIRCTGRAAGIVA